VTGGGDALEGKVALVTGAATGIGRAFKQTADQTNAFAETVGFSYTSMKLTYFKQKQDGPPHRSRLSSRAARFHPGRHVDGVEDTHVGDRVGGRRQNRCTA
jgi:NADPH:quinone reductase-like Zn-dependent oxidoreductase